MTNLSWRALILQFCLCFVWVIYHGEVMEDDYYCQLLLYKWNRTEQDTWTSLFNNRHQILWRFTYGVTCINFLWREQLNSYKMSIYHTYINKINTRKKTCALQRLRNEDLEINFISVSTAQKCMMVKLNCVHDFLDPSAQTTLLTQS